MLAGAGDGAYGRCCGRSRRRGAAIRRAQAGAHAGRHQRRVRAVFCWLRLHPQVAGIDDECNAYSKDACARAWGHVREKISPRTCTLGTVS